MIPFAPHIRHHLVHQTDRKISVQWTKMATIGVSVLLLASVVLALSNGNALNSSVYDARVTSFTEFLSSSPPQSARPSQIHVAFASEVNVKSYSVIRTSDSAPEEMRLGMTISWSTAQKTRTSRVRFGLSRDDLSMMQQAEERCEQYDFCSYTSPWFHHVTIPGDKLEAATTYYCTWYFVSRRTSE